MYESQICFMFDRERWLKTYLLIILQEHQWLQCEHRVTSEF